MSASTPPPASRATPRVGGEAARSVLVVDGRSNDGLILVVALESWGYAAAWARDAAEALRQAGEMRPAVIVLDVTLSGGRGGDLTAELHQRLGSLPILVGITPPADDPAPAASAEAGFAALFARPVDLPALRRFLDETLPPR